MRALVEGLAGGRQVAGLSPVVPTIAFISSTPRVFKFLVVALLFACIAVIGWLAYVRTRLPSSEQEMLDRAVKLTRKGHNVKAAKLIERWIDSHPRNHSAYGFLHEQIALLYIREAEVNGSTRSETVPAAEANLEQAVAAFDKGDFKGDDSNSSDLYEFGQGYEALGDLAGASRCLDYLEADRLYTRRLAMVRIDSVTANGKAIPLDPVRAEIEKHLDAVNDKISKANCQKQ